MTTPTNLKTGTVDIGVNAYSKPVNTAAIEAVGAGMDMWASESKRRFNAGYEQDLENLRTLQESDPIVRDSVAASELMNKNALQGGLNDVDKKTLKDIERKYEDLDFLLEQGKTSWDMYRLRGSNMLRNAIMLRPDLGDEFRRIAANKLGTDVNNAYLEIWKEGQDRLSKQLSAGQGGEDSGISNSTFTRYLELNKTVPNVMTQQSNIKTIQQANDLFVSGDVAGAKAKLLSVSWGGDANPAVAARDTFLNAQTQTEYASTLGRMHALTKLGTFDAAGFEQERPNLEAKQTQLIEWRSAIEKDNSNIIANKDELLGRIDAMLTPINQVLSSQSDEEKANIIRNAAAVSTLRLTPTARAVVQEISPYAPNLDESSVSLVTDGIAMMNADNPEFANYTPQSAYAMTQTQLNQAFGTVLVKTDNNEKMLMSTTKALSYMLVPYAKSRNVGGRPMMQSPQQMYNVVQILNASNGELLARASALAQKKPGALRLQVALRYGMIAEMQKSRFAMMDAELRGLVEVPELSRSYGKSGVAIPIDSTKFKISDKATAEQRARIVQWGKENPPALNSVAYTMFVNDTITMAGKLQGAK